MKPKKQRFCLPILLCILFCLSACGAQTKPAEKWLLTPEQASGAQIALPEFVDFSTEPSVRSIIAVDGTQDWEIVRFDKKYLENPLLPEGALPYGESVLKDRLYALTRSDPSAQPPSLQLGNEAMPAAKLGFVFNFKGQTDAEISFLLLDDLSGTDLSGGVPANSAWIVLSGSGDLYRRYGDGNEESLGKIELDASKLQNVELEWEENGDYIALKYQGKVAAYVRQTADLTVSGVRFDCTPGVLIFGVTAQREA